MMLRKIFGHKREEVWETGKKLLSGEFYIP
jgi:hypothetical protein